MTLYILSLYVNMSVTVSYGHLARGLEIVSVAIPMASSCSIHFYKVLNSRFRLLPNSSLQLWRSVRRQIEAVSVPFLSPLRMKIPLVHGDAELNGVSYPKSVPGGSKALGLKNPLIAQLPDAGYTLAI